MQNLNVQERTKVHIRSRERSLSYKIVQNQKIHVMKMNRKRSGRFNFSICEWPK